MYGVTHATGETHFQRYLGVGVSSDDLQVGIVTEESYLIVLEEAAVDAKLLSISATATANLVGGASIVTLSNEAVEVRANYSDGTSVALNPADCTLSFTDGQLVYAVTPGSSLKVGSAEYTPAGGETLQADVMLVAKASAQEGQTTQVGASDFSGAWFDNGYLTASKNWTVAPGTSETVRLTLGSDNALNFHSPSVVLHNADAEYCVVRMDHFGWGGSYESAVVTSNWNWDTFAPTLNGSVIDITVANDGAGKASIRYHVISSDNSEHFQYYDGIPVSGDDVQFFVATEGAYLVFE